MRGMRASAMNSAIGDFSGIGRAALLALVAMSLSACEARYEYEEAKHKFASPCEPIMFENAHFTLCTAEPGKHRIAVDLAPPDSDEPYGSFAAFAEAEPKVASKLAMAMNGGMFDEQQQPVGYYVEEGRRLTVVNEAEGEGNFFLKPNGVFFGSADGPWRVLETGRFTAQADERPEFATQSGPMLVSGGRMHPAIEPDGPSRHIRNAVGVTANGRALFVKSEDPVSFGKLARLYRDVLNTENALYLDGAISQLWDPANERMDSGNALGPLILVENRAQAAP